MNVKTKKELNSSEVLRNDTPNHFTSTILVGSITKYIWTLLKRMVVK